MRVRVSNVSDSHGDVFTLHLERSEFRDNEVINFLRKTFMRAISGKNRNTYTFYIHGIEVTKDGVAMQLVEQNKHQVADLLHMRNAENYTVLRIECDANKVPGDIL